MVKKPFFDPIFQFSWVPPLENAKNRFSNMKSPLKMAKLPEVLVIFWFFSFFDPKTMILTIFDPKNQKTPEKVYPPPGFDVITKPQQQPCA